MHSFRLRYIGLGLLIYIQSAFCRTCGSEFHDDITSRAIIAKIVVEAKFKKAHELVNNDYYNVTFGAGKIHKGVIPPKEDGGRRRSILVGTFGIEDKTRCITPVDTGSQLILFLKPSLDGRYYELTGFPVHADKRSKKAVRNGVCRKCGEC